MGSEVDTYNARNMSEGTDLIVSYEGRTEEERMLGI